MLKNALVLALALCLSSACWANESLQRLILEKEGTFRTAMVKADLATFEALLGDDLHAMYPDGSVADKAGQLRLIGKRWTVRKVEASDLKVRTYNDDTAVVTGLMTFEGTYDGKKIDLPRHFTHVWVKQGADWKLVSRHLSTVNP